MSPELITSQASLTPAARGEWGVRLLSQSIKILIVDDDEDSREIVVLPLRRMGFDVIESRSGEEEIEKALGEKPDLIIMELRLPGTSGIETATRLKNSAATSHIPIVGYTAWDKIEFKNMARGAGIVDFLVKPISAQLLNKAIQRLLEIKRPD